MRRKSVVPFTIQLICAWIVAADNACQLPGSNNQHGRRSIPFTIDCTQSRTERRHPPSKRRPVLAQQVTGHRYCAAHECPEYERVVLTHADPQAPTDVLLEIVRRRPVG